MAFVEKTERPQGEELPHRENSRPLKLSEAILEGCKLSAPTHDIGIEAWVKWQGTRCFSCVVGAAWLGATGGDEEHYWSTTGNRLGRTAELLNVPGQLLMDAQYKYECLRWTREEVACDLARQGY